MDSLLAGLVPTLLLILAMLFMAVPIAVNRWLERRAGRRSPLTRDLLRGPGESLRNALGKNEEDIYSDLFRGIFFGVAAPSVVLWQACFGGMTPSVGLVLLMGLSTAVILFYFGYRLTRHGRMRRRLRLGLEGELAVAEELSQLGRAGFHVFHDLPAEGFNIDHVVLGPTGLFAVETKTRAKPTTGDGQRDATVTFDGTVLEFPWGRETRCLEQTARQAKWLHQWVSSAVGEPVPAQGVLVLPGWYVKRKGRGAVGVISPREKLAYFPKVLVSRLDETMLGRIAHQLEARCRSVAPEALPRQPSARIGTSPVIE